MREYCGLTDLKEIKWNNLNRTQRKCFRDMKSPDVESFISELSSLGDFNLCDPLKQLDPAENTRCSMKCIDSKFEER